jgi:hypothetical protein
MNSINHKLTLLFSKDKNVIRKGFLSIVGKLNGKVEVGQTISISEGANKITTGIIVGILGKFDKEIIFKTDKCLYQLENEF